MLEESRLNNTSPKFWIATLPRAALLQPLPGAISEVIRKRMDEIPPSATAELPDDGASEHDHYLYGWPKKNQ